MSRRDTIIVAVLVNIGLLAVLFMMAVQTEKQENFPTDDFQTIVIAEVKEQTPTETKTEIILSHPRDELDQVLKNYPLQSYATTPSKPEEAKPETKPLKQKPTIETSKDKSQTVSDENRYVDVTVKRGDYLEKIARANGTTIEEIMKANRLSNERIDIGQILKIPVADKNTPEVTQTPKKIEKPKSQIAAQDEQYYILKSGDNPWKIAREFRVKFDDLLKLNELDEEKARNLKPGDTLRVR